MPEQIQVQRPAVLIGLGGTGKQALQYLRRLFLDRYGVKTLPHIAMLVIDTDSREQNLDGSSYDEFDREVAFNEDLGEIVVAPVAELQGNVRRNRSQYPYIDNWLDRALDGHGDIHDGAGQIRAIGRLAFFKNYPAIQAAIHNAYATVTRDAAHVAAQAYNIQVETREPVETWFVFSVAGGTGSGMFLDAAFLAKQEASAFGAGGARSLILLPTAFSNNPPATPSAEGRHRLFANSYAALTELEYYNYPQTTNGTNQIPRNFELQWTKEQFEQTPRTSIAGPVFVNSFLVDSAPRDGGGLVSDRMDLCRMMAEWLFVQYSSVAPALSGEIRSARSNDGNDLLPLTSLGNKNFSSRYSSVGLSKIYVSTTNLANQAYARLIGDLATQWQIGSKQSDVRKSIEGRLYSKIHLPLNGATRGFTDALGRRLSIDGTSQPLTRRFENLIDDEFRKLKARNFEPGAETEARDWFSAEVMTKLLDGGSAAKVRRGEISRIVQVDNTAKTQEGIRDALDAFMVETLQTPGERLDFAEQALRLIVKDYLQAARQATDRGNKEKARGDRLQSEANRLLTWANDHGGFDRATLFAAAFAKMRERAQAEFRRQVFETTAQVATAMANYVGTGTKVKDADGREKVVDTGLLSTLSILRQTLKALVKRSEERIGALQRQPASAINTRAPAKKLDGVVTPEAELDEIYKTEWNEEIGEDAIARHEEELYRFFTHKGFTSPWYLRDHADSGDVEQAFTMMMEFARRQLAYLPDRMQDALDCLSKQFGSDRNKFEAEIAKVVERGSPWLPKHLHPLAGDESSVEGRFSRYYLAVSKAAATGPKSALFKASGISVDKAGQPISGGKRRVVDGPLDTVYLEAEVIGLPLGAVRYIDKYRNAYLGYLASDDAARRVVHTELDLEKYIDLVPLTEAEQRLQQEAICAFAQGVAQGVIVQDPAASVQSSLPDWRFMEYPAGALRPAPRPLGLYTNAIRVLSRPDRLVYSALNNEIAKTVITQDDSARLYAVLAIMQNEPPVGGDEWGDAIAVLLDSMRRKYGAAIVEQAKEADKTAHAWMETLSSGSAHPFLRLRALAQTG